MIQPDQTREHRSTSNSIHEKVRQSFSIKQTQLGSKYYVLIDLLIVLIIAALGLYAMTSGQIFSRPARPNSVNEHFII